MFNTETLLRSAAGSGILQWSDTPSEWGQGLLATPDGTQILTRST
jgi:hypothetical protein